ncbi:MAG: DUF4838 domain-containing protein, partial [Planctomycetota bacterium]
KDYYAEISAELQDLVKTVTGAELPIVAARNFKGGTAVYLGESAASKKAGFTKSDVPVEGFQVVTGEGTLAILGHDEGATEALTDPRKQRRITSQGTRFGMIDVLERQLGVRFYFPGPLGTVWPDTKSFTVEPTHYLDKPMLEQRTMYPWHSHPDSPKDHRRFGARWRSGNGSGMAFNHSHTAWGKLYGDTHPEYFALKPDGTRDTTYFGGHLCYTEPGVLKQEIENIDNWFKKQDWKPWGKKWLPPRNGYISILPNDVYGGCLTKECLRRRDLRKAEIPVLEQWSELIHWYYAEVAREAKQRWPEQTVVFGAYSSYTFPPKTVTYPDNTLCFLCVMDGIAYHKEPEVMQRWIDIARRYKKLTGRKVHVWQYMCWPQSGTQAPIHIPNLVVQWHRKHRDTVAGEFINWTGNRSYAMEHLTLYFLFRAMWNPDFDVRAALDEYYRLCYGPAHEPMKAWYDLMIDRWETVQWDGEVGRVGGLPLDELYGKTYSLEVLKKLKQLEVKALAAAPDNTDAGRRVRYVIEAHQEFYEEAELLHRLNRGSVLYVQRGTPTVDGKLDDACWAPVGTQMVDKKVGRPAPLRSMVQARWDDEAVYVAVDFAEPAMDKLKTVADRRDRPAWDDDAIELFVAAHDTLDHYVQLAVNTTGVMLDGVKPAEGTYSSAVNLPGIVRAVHKRKDGWSMEVKVPYRALEVKPPKPGTSWRANVIRVRRAGGVRESFALSPTMGRGHHDPKYFGTLVFTGKDALHESFDPGADKRWTARVRNPNDDPKARATLSVDDGTATLEARMSTASHIATMVTEPGVEIRRGDLLEVLHRGPAEGGRLGVQFWMRVPGTDKLAWGWKADNDKVPAGYWTRFVVDPFELAKVKADTATLGSLRLLLSSPPGTTNRVTVDLVRISRHTAANVD